MNNTSTITPSQTAHRAQVVSKGTLIHPIPLACNDKATATAKHHQTAHSASTLQPACIPSVTQNACHWPARYRRGRNEAPPSTGRAQRSHAVHGGWVWVGGRRATCELRHTSTTAVVGERQGGRGVLGGGLGRGRMGLLTDSHLLAGYCASLLRDMPVPCCVLPDLVFCSNAISAGECAAYHT